MTRELLAEYRQQVDLADAGIGLRVVDPHSSAGEVDVAPAKRERLPERDRETTSSVIRKALRRYLEVG